MSGVKNTMGLIKKSGECIDVRYVMTTKNINDIYAASRNPYDMICNGFRFGYMQGLKAARAERKAGQGHE